MSASVFVFGVIELSGPGTGVVVNQLSLVLVCQPIVGQCNTERNPQFEGQRRRKLFTANSSIVIQYHCENLTAAEEFNSVTAQLLSSTGVEQHGCEAVQPWGQSPLLLDSSALVETSLVFHLQCFCFRFSQECLWPWWKREVCS